MRRSFIYIYLVFLSLTHPEPDRPPLNGLEPAPAGNKAVRAERKDARVELQALQVDVLDAQCLSQVHRDANACVFVEFHGWYGPL